MLPAPGLLCALCREMHLSTLLSKLHPFLLAQGVNFDSFVIEQVS